MPWPDEPCPACPRRDFGGCRAQRLRNATLCRHAANGHEGYRALLARGPEEVARTAVETNQGIASIPLAGDLVAALTKRMSIDRLAKYVAEQLGAECGCSKRQAALNALDAKFRRFLGW
jgi:hypothetical protein